MYLFIQISIYMNMLIYVLMNCAFHIMVICKFDHVNCRKTYEQLQKTENIDKQIPVDAKKNENRATGKINCNATRNVRIKEITKK